MQLDMHFNGTFSLARAAGIPENEAYIIAYASQYVDDSTKRNSTKHKDGGLLFGLATSHNEGASFFTHLLDLRNLCKRQREVWIPFHFLPGGQGTTFTEQLRCVKDSNIAREMMENHIAIAADKTYGLELIGIAAHVYMDTFSHYGFSGKSCASNAIVDESLKVDGVTDPQLKQYVLDDWAEYITPKKLGSKFTQIIERFTGALGHGGVGTFPDRPYQQWSFEYELDNTPSIRDNRETFLDGAEGVHSYFCQFAKTKNYDLTEQSNFADIKNTVTEIIHFQGKKEERAAQWTKHGLMPEHIKYSSKEWENSKRMFHKGITSSAHLTSNVYRFHQAAAYHRYYVLKDLLPSHGLAVY